MQIDRTSVPLPNSCHDHQKAPNSYSNRNLFYYTLSLNTVDPRRNTIANPIYVPNTSNKNTVQEATDDST